jgi:hypothetical protein
MSFAADFGLHLAQNGASTEMDILLAPFVLNRISVVNETLFTTISGMDFDGETYAVSLDFGAEILQGIKRLYPKKTALLIESELQDQYVKGHTLFLPKPLELAVTARLGEVQKAQYEDFIPLVVQSANKFGRQPKRSQK